MRCVKELEKRWIPEAAAALCIGDLGESEIRNGVHGLERRTMIYMGGMMRCNTGHRAGQAVGRGGQRGLGMVIEVGSTDDGGVRHSRGQRRQRERVELPERLAA